MSGLVGGGAELATIAGQAASSSLEVGSVACAGRRARRGTGARSASLGRWQRRWLGLGAAGGGWARSRSRAGDAPVAGGQPGAVGSAASVARRARRRRVGRSAARRRCDLARASLRRPVRDRGGSLGVDGVATAVGTRRRRRNIASSSWKRSPPMPARFGSIAARRRPAAASAGGSCRARPSGRPSAATSSARIASTAWSSSARMSRPRSSRPSSSATPGGAVAADEVVDERLDDLGVGQAEQVAHVRLVDPVGRGRQQLVEHRFGVAHPAGGEAGDEVDGGRVGHAAVGGEDPA